jgi:hypothetical protein
MAMSDPTCIDLRPWAKEHRYRWRYEESYQAEKPENRGDGRWYVEIVCRYGLIYPKGGNTLLAYCSSSTKRKVVAVGPGIEHYQQDGNNVVLRFPAELLDQVAAILKPKRIGGSTKLSPEQLANLQEGRKRLEKRRQNGAKNDAITRFDEKAILPPSRTI